MTRSVLVVHGHEAAATRVRAVAPRDRVLVLEHGQEAVQPLETLLRGMPTHESLRIVHLAIETVDPGQVREGISSFARLVRERFPAAETTQWVVWDVGRGLDEQEHQALQTLLAGSKADRLKAVFVVTTSTSRDVAGEEDNAVGYVSDAVLTLLLGDLGRVVESTELLAVASSSVVYRPERAARGVASIVCHERILSTLLAQQVDRYRDGDRGASDVRKVGVDDFGDQNAVFEQLRNDLRLGITTVDEPNPGAWADAIVSRYEEMLLTRLPRAKERAKRMAADRRTELESALRHLLQTDLQRQPSIQTAALYLEGMAREMDSQIDRITRQYSDVAVTSIDGAVDHLVAQARSLPYREALFLRGLGAGVLIGTAAALTIGPLAVLLGLIGPVAAWALHTFRQVRVKKARARLEVEAQDNLVNQLDRYAAELRRDTAAWLRSLLGNITIPVPIPEPAEAADQESGESATDVPTLAEQLELLGREGAAARDTLAAGREFRGLDALKSLTFSLVIPSEGESASDLRHKVGEAVLGNAGDAAVQALRQITLKWDADLIVDEMLSAASHHVAPTLSTDLANLLEDPHEVTRVSDLLRHPNPPALVIEADLGSSRSALYIRGGADGSGCRRLLSSGSFIDSHDHVVDLDDDFLAVSLHLVGLPRPGEVQGS